MKPRDMYPLYEKAPDRVRTASGKRLDEITVDAVVDGKVRQEDLAISAEALRLQAEIARDAGRAALAENFERAAELVAVPQPTIMETYEMLRPGRADAATLMARAAMLRGDYGAHRIAEFIEEAARVYEARGMFTRRF